VEIIKEEHQSIFDALMMVSFFLHSFDLQLIFLGYEAFVAIAVHSRKLL